MKILKTGLLIFAIGTFFSCENNEGRQINDGSKEIENSSRKNSLDENNIQSNRDKDLNSEINSPSMDKMYNDLEMTDDQIYRFEKEYNKAIKSIKNSNDNTVEKDKQIERKQDEVLKSVLSEDQYL